MKVAARYAAVFAAILVELWIAFNIVGNYPLTLIYVAHLAVIAAFLAPRSRRPRRRTVHVSSRPYDHNNDGL